MDFFSQLEQQHAIRLTDQQRQAVNHAGGPALLLSVPGSGKTTTLVTRLGYLIHCLGVEPGRILTVTYTVAAAGGHEAALCRPLWGGARRRAGLPHHQRHLPVHHLLLRLGQGGRALRPVDERGGAERPGALADAVPRGRVAGGAGGEGGAHPHHLLQERDAAGRGGAGH